MNVAVCLYSKYSQRCKEFLDDVRDEMGIRMLCIDNKKVREQIERDENGYHVKMVPCVFLFFSNGRLEKFEGSDAFVWLRKVQERLAAVSPSSSLPKEDEPQQIEETRDEVGMDMIETEIETPLLPPPPPLMPTNAEQMMEKEMNLRRASDQIITRKQDNIKDIAQMMQRQRESEEERMNPPPPGSIMATRTSS